MRKLLKKLTKQFGAIALLGLLICICIFWFWIKPLLSSINEMKAKIESNYRSKENIEVKLKDLKDLEARLEVYSDSISVLSEFLPEGKQEPELLVTFERIAQNSGVILRTISPLKIPPKEQPKEFKKAGYSLNLVGDYHPIKLFIQQLERNKRLINIRTIKFSGGGEEREGIPQPLNVTLEIEAYYKG